MENTNKNFTRSPKYVSFKDKVGMIKFLYYVKKKTLQESIEYVELKSKSKEKIARYLILNS